MTSTKNYSQADIDNLKAAIDSAERIIIGAGAGLSTAAGLQYGGDRFKNLLQDFGDKYGYEDMYSAGFYPYRTFEEYWGYWSKHVYYNRYDFVPNDTYENLKKLVEDKDYFVITTNADHLFLNAGFDKEKLFYVQGDYGLWQCSRACHQETYSNEEEIKKMMEITREDPFKIPKDLIPHCPKCEAPLDMNLRKDHTFVEPEGWTKAMRRYEEYLRRNHKKSVLLLELGVGGNTPTIIKYPFWDMARFNNEAQYVCLNLNDAQAPKDLEAQSICIQDDIHSILTDLVTKIIVKLVFFHKIQKNINKNTLNTIVQCVLFLNNNIHRKNALELSIQICQLP